MFTPDLFGDLDRMDSEAWAARLAPEAVLRCGTGEPVYGRAACRAALDDLYTRIAALRHDVFETWQHGAATVSETMLTVTRTDGDELHIPAVTITRTDTTRLISDYRVYADLAPIYA